MLRIQQCAAVWEQLYSSLSLGRLFIIPILGATKLIPFLISGGPSGRLSLMFSVNGYNPVIGQGPGTSTRALVSRWGATPLNPLSSGGQGTGYVLDGRTLVSTEGGLTKTWLELGILGVALYGGVFFSTLAPIARSPRLDGAGRALTILALALGIVFLKGHQDLDDPLVQPLFWLAVGGAWGRMRVLDSRCEKRLAVKPTAVLAEGYPGSRGPEIGPG